MLIAFLFATQSAISATPAVPLRVDPNRTCAVSNAKDILVCGRKGNRYRIDPAVADAERAVNAAPSKVQSVDPDDDQPCVGPHCGGDFLPLVAVGYKLVTAAVDAATGKDWKNDFRTHPDEYAAYRDAKDRSDRKATFSLSASASSARK